MKVASIAVALALFTTTSAFAPNGALPAVRIAQPTNALDEVVIVGRAPATSSRDSSLSLFGSRWRKARKFNSPAKAGGADITEKEVRALFELWNSALATGDSRIVASRYTKVRVGLSLC
mmetsp:Transcript_4548/g.7918  ORF Transcript_4548/g.7918 Transcript_4548/m.7918 type:complete len:119 (-) Transcript_4548:1405-1761(-)